MPIDDDLPPHGFGDQAIRERLENPANLREILHEALGDLADGFVCEEREILKREFPLEDWRHRECDVLFRIPYRASGETIPVLVCVLVEHQSRPDARMPLRTLLYAALYWEREWKAWEGQPVPRSALRLTPVVPIVFHTGKATWSKNRELADMIDGPEALRKFAPVWQPLFLDLGGKTPWELLQAAGEWLRTLAVVRADKESREGFGAVLAEVLRRLEGLAEKDKARWYDLVYFALQWALYRRSPEERENLVELALTSQTNAARQREVQTVSQTIAEELRAEGKVEGRLEQAREILRDLLEQRFGALNEALVHRIGVCNDLSRLNAALRSVNRIGSVDEVQV
jgi:hypothetical protein